MRVRHRIPSIFNLSLVDVLCCALGCVILLWLLNLREAKHHEDTAAEQARQATDRLDAASAERDVALGVILEQEGRIAGLEDEQEALKNRLTAQGDAARELEQKLRASTRQAADLDRDLKAASTRVKSLQALADRLPRLEDELKKARVQLANEEAINAELEKDLARRKAELDDASKGLVGMKATRKSLEDELALARSYKDKWATELARVQNLEKKLEGASRSIETLEEDKRALKAEAARVRNLADNRFAGIELVGRRVVFLVDKSGSMDYVDEKTQAPGKWMEVRQTLSRVMRSLPALEKFQVIVFAEKASFLLGQEGRWLDYDPKISPDRVLAALAATKPEGNTNMYAAIQSAFSLRAQGLDTVYLFSDGLPNVGEGLTADNQARLALFKESESAQKEALLGEYLGNHIRKKLKDEWNRAAPGRERVRINTIGFFYESPDVGAFLWALARENEGSFVGMSKP